MFIQVFVMICFIEFLEVLLILAMFTETTGFDYCQINTCRTKEHTMCRYSSDKLACSANGADIFTGELRRAILHFHNLHRQNVSLGRQPSQPRAGNMMKLSWHDEAERIAQRWADQCSTDHDLCRRLQHSDVGQNIATGIIDTSGMDSYSLQGALKELMEFWYKEVYNFDRNQVAGFQYKISSGQQRYTQLVWAETTAVGCGILLRAEYISDLHHYRNVTLICNYVVSGNYENEQVYERGLPCSKCPAGTSCSKAYPGLCTSDKSDFGGNPRDGKDSGSCVPMDLDSRGVHGDADYEGVAATTKLSVLALVSLLFCVLRYSGFLTPK